MCVEPSNEHWSFSVAVNMRASQVAVESTTRVLWPTANDSVARYEPLGRRHGESERTRRIAEIVGQVTVFRVGNVALGPETRGGVLN
jgi:hypothetical protein